MSQRLSSKHFHVQGTVAAAAAAAGAAGFTAAERDAPKKVADLTAEGPMSLSSKHFYEEDSRPTVAPICTEVCPKNVQSVRESGPTEARLTHPSLARRPGHDGESRYHAASAAPPAHASRQPSICLFPPPWK